MTTNAGAEAIKNESAFGFSTGKDEDASYQGMKSRVKEEIEKVFRPEFLNRLDDIIVFHHLTVEHLKEVIDLELGKVRERLEERGLKLTLTDAAKAFVIRKGSDTDFGARPLRRALEQLIEDPLSEELLRGEFAGKDAITVDVKEIGDKKRLDFVGYASENAEAEPVGAVADGGEETAEEK